MDFQDWQDMFEDVEYLKEYDCYTYLDELNIKIKEIPLNYPLSMFGFSMFGDLDEPPPRESPWKVGLDEIL